MFALWPLQSKLFWTREALSSLGALTTVAHSHFSHLPDSLSLKSPIDAFQRQAPRCHLSPGYHPWLWLSSSSPQDPLLAIVFTTLCPFILKGSFPLTPIYMYLLTLWRWYHSLDIIHPVHPSVYTSHLWITLHIFGYVQKKVEPHSCHLGRQLKLLLSYYRQLILIVLRVGAQLSGWIELLPSISCKPFRSLPSIGSQAQTNIAAV